MLTYWTHHTVTEENKARCCHVLAVTEENGARCSHGNHYVCTWVAYLQYVAID